MAENTNSQYVVDASYVLAFLHPDESTSKIKNEFKRHSEGEVNFISTFLLPFEVLNSLLIATRRKRVDFVKAMRLADNFFKLNISLLSTDFLKSLALAKKFNITVYDASYVDLALSQKLPLLTFDKKLKKIAQ